MNGTIRLRWFSFATGKRPKKSYLIFFTAFVFHIFSQHGQHHDALLPAATDSSLEGEAYTVGGCLMITNCGDDLAFDDLDDLMMIIKRVSSIIARALVSVAGVWGGTARALKVFAVGDNLDSWSHLIYFFCDQKSLIKNHHLRFLNSKNLLWERTNPSLAWLMPQQGFWSDDEVLMRIMRILLW